MTRPGTAHMVAGCLAVSLLGACANAEVTPTVRQVADVESPPVVQQSQLDRVVADLAAVAAASDAASDVGALEARFVGPAFDGRRATYEAKAKFAERRAPVAVGTDRLVDIVPKTHNWPRSVMTVTQSDATTTPVLRVLWQENARAPYREAAESGLLPGATVPSFPGESEGTDWVDPADGAGLVTSVNDAVTAFADVLMRGASSEHLDVFAGNAFYETVGKEQQDESTAATTTCESCFDYEVNHALREGQVWAVRTANGGALAVAVLDVSRKFTVNKAGAKMPLDGELKALSGKSVATRALTISGMESIAFVIPPESEGGQVTLIGADRMITAVEAS